MNLNDTVLALRREKGYTQERLAEMLCVSTAAVSKWECGNAYPDITLLPKLAEIFDCSVDYLLGYDTTCRRSVEVIIAEANQLRKELRADEAEALIAQTLARYPGNTQLMFELARHKLINTRYKRKADRERLQNEALELFRHVAENESHDGRRAWALHFLSNIHLMRKEYDTATSYNSRLGGSVHGIYPQVTQAIIELHKSPGEEAARMMKEKLYNCIFEHSLMFSWYVHYLFDKGNYDEVIRECARASKVYEEFSDCGWIYNDLSYCHEAAALAYANNYDFENCLDHLEKAYNCAVEYDSQDWNMTYNVYSLSAELSQTEEHISSRRSLLCTLNSAERSAYDPIRNTKRYRKIIEKLTETIGK